MAKKRTAPKKKTAPKKRKPKTNLELIQAILPPDLSAEPTGKDRYKGNFGKLTKSVSTDLESIIGPKRNRPRDPVTGRRCPRTPQERMADVVAVAHMSNRGWSQGQMMDYLDLIQEAVVRDLQSANRYWREAVAAERDEQLGKMLHSIRYRKGILYELLERSKMDEVTITEGGEAESEDGSAKTRRPLVKRKGKAGDPKIMELIGQCDRDEMNLLGLSAPKKHQIAVRQEGIIEMEHVSEDDLRSLADIHARAAQAKIVKEGTGGGASPGLIEYRCDAVGDSGLQVWEPVPTDCVPVASPADPRQGRGEVVSGDTLAAIVEEPGDGEVDADTAADERSGVG